ncbi:MAG: hypothetical protein AAGB05_17645 [Pseudomonadota bacterium]
MARKSEGTDPAEVKGWISDARKKPISFAALLGANGVVMQADKVKSPDQMRKAAKAKGGGKGCWGTMEVQQKTLLLHPEGAVPGGFDKQIRKLLSEAGISMQVSFASVEAEAEAEEQSSGTEDAEEVAPVGQGGESLAVGSPDGTDDEEDDEEDGAIDLAATIALARKRPLNFACLVADDGVALVAHRKKPTGLLVKRAKALGGKAQGGWGTLTVEGKSVVLTCEEDPPGKLGRLLRLHLRAHDLKFAVVVRSPSGEVTEDEEGDDAGAVGRTAAQGTDAQGALAQDRSLEEDLSRAEAVVRRAVGQLSEKQLKMAQKLLGSARQLAGASPSKAAASLTLLMRKLEGMGVDLSDPGAGDGADLDALLKRRGERLGEIAALRARAKAVMERIAARAKAEDTAAA